MPNYSIVTLGCKVNTYESEFYIESLNHLGYVYDEFNPDICIVNTCTVTNTAAAKSRQKIHQAKKNHPNAMICAVGCLVQTDESIEKEELDLLIGATEKNRLAELIDDAYQNKKKINTVRDITEKNPFEEMVITDYYKQTRAFLKIQDGCNQFCSYCTIPLARGRERSLNLDKLVECARNLVQSGHREIVLTGIHTGRYQDEDGNHLIEVLKALKKTGVERIRISSIEITEITDEIIDFIAENEIMARHLHIPLQAGSDSVLKAMNRPYTSAYFIKRISEIRNRIPDIAIGTDIIVGFPQESEADYQCTKDVVEKANLDYLHVFPYSLRKNTVAAKMEQHCSSDVKKARCKDLIAMGNIQKKNYYSRFLGKELDVIYEQKEDGIWHGHSSEYIDVYCAFDSDLKGKRIITKIIRMNKNGLVGEIENVTE